METHALIKKIVLTEKSHGLETQKVYTALVNDTATKIDIKNAVEQSYGVNVEKVHVMTVRKKERVLGKGRVITKRKAAKKALVFLKKGEKPIDFIKLKK